MKILLCSLALGFGLTTQVFAQALCTLSPTQHDPRFDAQATPYANGQMQSVNFYLCQKFGCPPYRFVQNSSVQNALAVRDHTGNTIRYNSAFMNNVVQNFGSFATAGILAHELGHIIDFSQNALPLSPADREATADRYAGCAFALAGNPETDLQGLAQTLHAMGPSPGYPTPTQRVALIRVGYRQCSQ